VQISEKMEIFLIMLKPLHKTMTHWMPEVAIRVKAGFIQPIKAIPRIHPSFFAVSKFTIISLYTKSYGNLKHVFYSNLK
jgi:hypothetical protein